MKEIRIKEGKTIRTPWLRASEAAAYCGVSVSYFDKHAEELPHQGSGRVRIYHEHILDQWINGELDVPFFGSSSAEPKPRRRRSAPISEDYPLRHPATGKVYNGKKNSSAESHAD